MSNMTENHSLEHLTVDRISRARKALSDAGFDHAGSRLIDLADSVLMEVDEIDLSEPYPEDRCHEIADSTVPVYTAEILETVSEAPALWNHEPELGPAFDGSPTPNNIGAGIIYEALSNVAHQALSERQREADDES